MDKVKFGNTDMEVFKIALGGYPFAGINRAQGWDPYTADGRKEAIKTVHAALDNGINYIDTAMSYGKGNSESIIGEALATKPADCFIATKCGWGGGAKEVVENLEASLKRLRRDYVDVIQLHGGRFTSEDQEHIINGGPLDGLREAKRRGLARYIGFTTEEPWTGIPLVMSDAFDVVQVCYNLIRQSAGQHFLDETKKRNLAVCAMRPLTSGIFQRELETLSPGWNADGEAFRVCMAFILSDSRVHMANVGMRWAREVEENVRFVRDFKPAADIADIPRMTQHIYETDDKRHGLL